MGGETENMADRVLQVSGLSPRGRGNHGSLLERKTVLRSIPAWAGKPRKGVATAAKWRVYPRVGGETLPDCA